VALSVRRPDGRPVRVSVGAAELRDSDAGADLLARADADLLEVKSRRGGSARAAS
jgi:GGDEF domain-containing protein